ncbi:ribonuclease H-like domain-containing protein [Tanacetum coccineum]
MFVHNSEHNSPFNSDQDVGVHDPVIRISKLDISDPLHLHPNDTTGLTVVSIKLKGTKNYQVWSCAMLLALEGKNKIGFIDDGSCKRSNTDEVLGKQWDRKQFNDMVELPKCVCNASESFKKHNQLMKLNQFLMGLDDFYMQIKSSILSRETLLDVRSAYAAISSEESHRVAVDNILDISYLKTKVGHLKTKVGHPNGTEAYISKIRNIRLSNCLTLYDVMVIPEYCLTLISVHKLVKENKVIITFDENRCYFLNQDLNLKNVMGIGEQCEGLYYYNNKGYQVDPVLNILKDSLNIDKKNNIVCWEICQRAKQTREPFPLSDHKSKGLGDLVHLDLWGPYKLIVKHSSVSGNNINTADFLVDSGNDADSSDDLVATQNEEDTTLEENIFPEGNLDQNPSSSQGVQNVRRSSRQSVFPKNYNDFVVESKVKYGLEKYVGYSKLNSEFFCFVTQLNKTREPKTYSEASKYSHWTNVMNQKIDALLRNGNWDLVYLPKGRKAIGSKWIYKIKFRSSGEIDRYKDRLVAQGFGQKKGIDYEKTFSPVVKMVTVRCLLNIIVSMSWPVFKLYVNNAFLYGDLEEAPRQWNAKLTSTLIENGFSQSKSDYSLYTKSDNGVFLALLVYVDDIIITGDSVSDIEKFKVFLKSKFMIKDLGKLKYFLGIEVIDTDKGIYLNQRKYVLDLLSKYGILACKPAKTPLMSKLVISNKASDKDPLLENITDY